MSRSSRLFFLLAILAALVWILPIGSVARGEPPSGEQDAVQQVLEGRFSQCTEDRQQPSGAWYRVCQPPDWWPVHNGDLVIWAHGYVDITQEVKIPEDQLCPEPGVCIPDIVNFFGYNFATTSYRVNGLAVVPGMLDLLEMIDLYVAEYGAPEHILLVGASEGGLITTLSVEGYPDLYDGGLAACGPIGDFRAQINYFGDVRAVLDYFYPGLIPGSPIDVPPELMEIWDNWYPNRVYPVLFHPGNRLDLRQFVRVSHLPIDEGNVRESMEHSVRDGVWYSVFATNDAIEVLGGQPFDNSTRWYHGSLDDEALNAGIERMSADPAALAEIEAHYQTSGVLSVPLVTMHTMLDQQVPFWHHRAYLNKTMVTGSWPEFHYSYPPIDVYGHCEFPVADILTAFFKLVEMVGGQVDASQAEQLLTALGPDTIVHLDD